MASAFLSFSKRIFVTETETEAEAEAKAEVELKMGRLTRAQVGKKKTRGLATPLPRQLTAKRCVTESRLAHSLFLFISVSVAHLELLHSISAF